MQHCVGNTVHRCKQYCSAMLHLIAGLIQAQQHCFILLTTRNNVTPTILLHSVFNNLERLIIFGRTEIMYGVVRSSCYEKNSSRDISPFTLGKIVALRVLVDPQCTVDFPR